jgi:hypothetical protein
VWLCTAEVDYLATASADVLSDGFVARGLCIGTPEDLQRHLESDLPDISAHLLARGNGMDLPAPNIIHAPASLLQWTSTSYELHILIRISERASRTHRITSGLRFTSDDGSSLLVGTDPNVLAMVFSQDPELIDRYCADCEALTPAEYRRLYG